MSEYQSYEFVALERPLTSEEMAALRRISTRAEISPTRFCNTYQWGDLNARPVKLLARYFDAFVYFADWPSYRFMLRLPIKDRRRAAAARKRHLAALAKQGSQAWTRLERRIEDRKYDEAVALTVDLRDVAASRDGASEFQRRIDAVQKQHARRRGYLDRLKVSLGGTARGRHVWVRGA